MNLAQFVKEKNIGFTTRPGANLDWSLQAPWQKSSNGHTCRLAYQGRYMTLDYWQGKGIKENPTAIRVLNSLLSDASGLNNSRDYLDWCSNYGCEPDNSESKMIYRATKKQTMRLKDLLGRDYELFLGVEPE
jgi:hypothetical protein